ncbi:hypothetical protein Tco_1315499 [Tanacetum coccineum]
MVTGSVRLWYGSSDGAAEAMMIWRRVVVDEWLSSDGQRAAGRLVMSGARVMLKMVVWGLLVAGGFKWSEDDEFGFPMDQSDTLIRDLDFELDEFRGGSAEVVVVAVAYGDEDGSGGGMAALVWGGDDGDDNEGGVMVGCGGEAAGRGGGAWRRVTRGIE